MTDTGTDEPNIGKELRGVSVMTVQNSAKRQTNADLRPVQSEQIRTKPMHPGGRT